MRRSAWRVCRLGTYERYRFRSACRSREAEVFFFFFNDPAPPDLSPLPLPAPFPTPAGLSQPARLEQRLAVGLVAAAALRLAEGDQQLADLGGVGTLAGRPEAAFEVVDGLLVGERSEEHTSELQSPCNLVCRLLLEKK